MPRSLAAFTLELDLRAPADTLKVMPCVRHALAAAVALGALVGAGCKGLEQPPPAPFQVYVKVESDPGHPIASAVIARGGTVLGTTGVDGRAILSIPGMDGESVDVNVKCPDAFQSPPKAVTIRLTRLADKTKVPEYAAFCPPTVRRVVVAIRAENGANLPVKYLGSARTRTDISGAAHLVLEVPPGQTVRLELDTTEKGNERLRPQNPPFTYQVGQQDAVALWDHKFQVEKKKIYYVAPKRPVNVGPRRAQY